MSPKDTLGTLPPKSQIINIKLRGAKKIHSTQTKILNFIFYAATPNKPHLLIYPAAPIALKAVQIEGVL